MEVAKKLPLGSVKRNWRHTLKDLTARFNDRTGYNVSERTVCRRLCFGGYKRRMICKKITLSRVNRDRRMGFLRPKLHWNVQNNWSSIIFSDETKIMLGRNGKSMFGGSPTKVFGPTVLASWTILRKPAVLLLCFGGALRTMELELLLLLMVTWIPTNIFQI